jgi:hypothetical protein
MVHKIIMLQFKLLKKVDLEKRPLKALMLSIHLIFRKFNSIKLTYGILPNSKLVTVTG